MQNKSNSEQYKVNKLPDYAIEGSVINVNSTSYDLFEDWMQVAKRHYNINIEGLSLPASEKYKDADVNLLKTGLFGYTNEIMAQEVKAAVAHRNVLYDEYFINSASFPESIYKFAKTYNVPISTARPARMLVRLAIRKSDLINSPLRRELIEEQYIQNRTLKSYEILLSRSYPFTLGKFRFMLPYDIKINLRQKNNNDFSITASYVIDNNLYKFTEFTSTEIRTYQDISDGVDYVYFDIDIYQIASQVSTFNVSTHNISDVLFFNAEYTDQIAGFNVYYTHLGKRYPINLYFNNTFTPSNPNEKYAYYTFVDDDKLQISFSSLPGAFRPEFNSSIEIEVLSTKGSEGNFTYSGKIHYNLENVDKSSFRTMLVSVKPITSASGGTDRLTIEQEKQRIINKMTTRDNLVTSKDLENYFNEINATVSYNKSMIKFMKKRDDVLLRVYNAFLLMKDEQEKVLPTNTAPMVRFPIKWFIDNNSGNAQEGYVLPEHSIFKYNEQSKKYEFLGDGFTKELKKEIGSDKDNLIYINPFLVRIDVDPMLNAYYYKLDINESFDMQYSYRNNLVDGTLLINRIDISKSSNFEEDLSSDTYDIKLNLNTNRTIQEVQDDIVIRGVLISAKTGEKYGYFDFNKDETVVNSANKSDTVFVAHLSTNRTFRKGKLSLTDSLYNPDGAVIDNVYIDEDCIIKVGVLYRDPEKLVRSSENLSTEVTIFNDAFPSDQQDSKNILDYVLATSVTSTQSIKLYRNLTDIMTSTVVRSSDQENLPSSSRDLELEMIPLVGIEYFTSNHLYLYKILDKYIKILNDTLPRLENNTKLDLKFYNTRGPSKFFYLNMDVSVDSLQTIDLKRTDVLFDFRIHVYETVSDEFDITIKDFIADFIEACNDKGIVPISNLISLLENTFDNIRYIEFNGISGTYVDNVNNRYQKILTKDSNLKNLTRQEVIEYVPEYINVKKQLKDTWIEYKDTYFESVSHKKSVLKTYENIINITYELM